MSVSNSWQMGNSTFQDMKKNINISKHVESVKALSPQEFSQSLSPSNMERTDFFSIN